MAKSIAEQKIVIAEQVQTWATELAGLDDFLSVVNARAFGQDGANEPTDDDLATLGITRDDYRNGMAMLFALEKFVKGTAKEATDISNRADVIARLRTDAWA